MSTSPPDTGASRTATAHAEADGNGAATYTFDIDWQISPNVSPTAPLVLHTGSIATALMPGASGVVELVDKHKSTATITFDPNIRSAFYENAAQALARVEEIVARADVVKASDEDMRWLDPESSPEELAARWLALGPAIVAVTFGADGSYAICTDGAQRIPAYPAEVVDTVGAGDSFMTGLIDALWDAGLSAPTAGGPARGRAEPRCAGCSRSPRCRRRSPSPGWALSCRIAPLATGRRNASSPSKTHCLRAIRRYRDGDHRPVATELVAREAPSMTTTGSAEQPSEAPASTSKPGLVFPKMWALLRGADLLFHRMGVAADLTTPMVARFKRIFDMNTFQASLFSWRISALLPAGHSGRTHQRAVRLQGRTPYGRSARRGRGDRVLPGEQDHDLRSVPGRLVRDRRRVLDTRNVREPLRAFAGSRRDRDPATNFAQAFNPVGTNIGVLWPRP